ncbi:MAG: hypothetical protein ABIH87_03675 [bacterium]
MKPITMSILGQLIKSCITGIDNFGFLTIFTFSGSGDHPTSHGDGNHEDEQIGYGKAQDHNLVPHDTRRRYAS